MSDLPSAARGSLGAILLLLFVLGAHGQETTETPTLTETPTATRTPVVLGYDPDLDGDGEVDPTDLLLMVQAWRVRDFIPPSPTPAFAPLLGFVVSAQSNLGVASATIIAGSDFALTSTTNGFFRIDQVRTDIEGIVVHKDGFQTLEMELDHPFPNLILSLFPNGFPTFTPTPSQTPTATRTFTPLPSQSSMATPTLTPTGAPSSTPTPTATPTRTPTRTPTPSRTPTPVPIAGNWIGKLNGTVLVGADITWTVHNGFQATAFARQVEYTGIYFFLNDSRVRFDGVGGTDAILLEMTWNGADQFTEGQYSITFPNPGPGGGSLSDSGVFTLDRSP